ncbi:hypothetical protein KY492_11395 [Brevibacterium sp. PAMC21349]|nr:hypothetical protein KY492_11395 [Brevibacterium sp. PAMC21349]
MTPNKFTVNDKLILIFLFLTSFEVFKVSHYWSVMLFFVTLIAMGQRSKNIKLYWQFITLAIFLLSYSTFFMIYGGSVLRSISYYALSPMGAYLAGIYLIKPNSSDINIVKAETKGSIAILILTLGFILHGILSYVFGFMNLSEEIKLQRFVYDFWSHEALHPTNFNSSFVIVVALIYYAIFYEKKKLLKVGMVLAVLFVCFISIETSSRTNLVLAALVMIVVFIFDIIVNRLPPKVRRRRTMTYVTYLLLILVLVVANYSSVLSWYESTNLFNRIEDNSQLTFENDGRWDQWYDVIVNMPSFIFGNMPTTIFLAHNFFLDVYRVAGVIPFFILIIYMISTIKILFKLLRSDRFTSNIKCLLFSIQFLFFLSFIFEPVMEGRPLSFFAYCFTNGITTGLLIKSRNFE